MHYFILNAGTADLSSDVFNKAFFQSRCT